MRPTLIAVFITLFLYCAFNLLITLTTYDNPDTGFYFITTLVNAVIVFNLIYNPRALDFMNKPNDPQRRP